MKIIIITDIYILIFYLSLIKFVSKLIKKMKVKIEESWNYVLNPFLIKLFLRV